CDGISGYASRDRLLSHTSETAIQAFVAVFGLHASRGVAHEFNQPILHPHLIENQMGEFTDVGRIVLGHRGARDMRWIVMIGPPDRHFGNAIGLVYDLVSEV